MSDVNGTVTVVPGGGQSTQEVAEVFTQVAASQGLAEQVRVEGENIVVPRALRTSMVGFPPRGDVYALQNPVDLIDLEHPEGPAVF